MKIFAKIRDWFRNYWYYYKWTVLIAVFFVGVIMLEFPLLVSLSPLFFLLQPANTPTSSTSTRNRAKIRCFIVSFLSAEEPRTMIALLSPSYQVFSG